ncbi:hypothetical protein QFC21_006808 [Naganishia friedmannii]|uniref:Uncharacterized protein n=1 Tax=Naganishia friedmannii TaxID=89922 RepID=A0ACC2V143_9TREE|nr:hypothetical protein QFC21_006808 [Naganishia friedmannii]
MFKLLSIRSFLPVLFPRTGGLTARSFSHTTVLASQRKKVLEDFRKQQGLAHYAAQTVLIKPLLEGLKTLQAERHVTNNNESQSHFFSCSSRAQADYRPDTLPESESALYRYVIEPSQFGHTILSSSAARYSDGYRDIIQICYPGQTELTVREIEKVVTEENSVVWRAIRDLVIDGQIPEILDLENDPRKAAAVQFARVHGIGRKRANELATLDYKTLDDLRKAPAKTLSRSSTDMEKLIPREEINIFSSIVRETLHKADPEIQFELMGMYRRGERISLDLDIVVWHESCVVMEDSREAEDVMRKVKDAFIKAGLMGSKGIFMDGMFPLPSFATKDGHVKLTLCFVFGEAGDKKLLFLTRVPPSHSHLVPSEDDKPATVRMMEVRVCHTESLPYFLLANTGDDMLMRIFREVAKERISSKMVINEYGMGDKKKDLPFGIPYLEPTQRSFKHYEKIFFEHPTAKHMLGL